MPLSENEQKLLEQMERAMYAEDPRFATHMKGAGGSGPSRKRVVIGVLAAVAGLGLVIAGVSTQLIFLGVIGFVVMVAGVAWAFTSGGKNGAGGAGAATGETPSRPSGSRKSSRARGSRGSGSGGSFAQRMEERWEKRRRENGGV